MKTFTKSIPIVIGIMAAFLLMGGNVARAQLYMKIQATFASEVLGIEKHVNVYLPSDYYVYPNQDYATVYYLHGGGGNQNEGHTSANLYYAMHSQDTTIDSPPAIFVCPDASCAPYLGSMYMNSELYGNYEDYIMQDVIGFVESNFRAKPDKNFRMISGISMGGYGSASLSSKYPEKFRACVPMSGGFSKDSMLYNFRTRCYQEQGTYNLNYTNGFYTSGFFTLCGGYSPNMDIEPYHIEIPFDTLGNWQDTVLSKWSEHEVIRRVKDLPDENELAWFLICGKQDELAFFPSHREFTDSLDFYGIGYDTSYFEGGHVFNTESWMTAIHWLDSIINYSYLSVGISDYHQATAKINVYPNPVMDRTVVALDIRAKNPVEICIYNIAGTCLKKWQYQNQQPGLKEYMLDLKDLTQGIYSCRVQIGNEMITNKIIKL